MSDSSAAQNPDRQARLEQVLAEYLHSVERGQPLDRQSLIAAHPGLADDLQSFFRNRDSMERLAEPLNAAADAPTITGMLDAEPAPAGTTVRYFGDYELLTEIARGGMGVVYKARQVNLKRIVALKMILAGQLANEQDVQRFHAEAEAAAKLDHSGIVPIFEIGQHDGQHYFSMAFIEGESLAKRAANGPLPPREAAELVKKVAEAVEYAHGKGIIHRDLKPANVLLDGQGQPKVTDFGLAKQLKGDSGLTGTGQILGTPSYMPPEQAADKVDQVGPPSDVYSLGAILYCLLTGRPPFQAASVVETLKQVLEQEPVSPRHLNPGLGQDLETICLKCLEKDPRRRYGSASMLSEDLRRFLGGEPIKARPTGQMERASKWVLRNKGLSAGLATAVLALLLGTILATWQAVEARIAANNEAKQRKIAEDERKAAAAARETAIHRLYAAHLNLARDAWNDGAVGRTLELLREWIPDSGQEDLRGFEWHYLWRCCHSARLTVGGSLRGFANAHIFRGVALSPDGQRVASGADNKTVVVRDISTGAQVLLLKTRNLFIPDLAYSADGRYLAAVSWDIGIPRPLPTATVWESVTGKEMYTITLDGEESGPLAFNPTGLELALTSGSGASPTKPWQVTVVQTVTGKLIRTFPAREAVQCVTFSPDGKRIALATSNSGATVVDSATGKELLTIPHPKGIRGVAFSPDGKRLATACPDGQVKIWNAANGENVFNVDEHTSSVDSVAFSPDGQRLASTSDDGTIRFWNPATGAAIGILKGHTSRVGNLVFSSDGKRLATAGYDRGVRVWDISQFTLSSQEVLVLQGFKSAVVGVVFSHDGKFLAVASAPGTVSLWNPFTGEAKCTLQASEEFVSGLAVSPDNRNIALNGLKTIRIWNWETNTELFMLDQDPNYPRDSIGFAVEGSQLAAFNPRGGVVEFWDVATRRLVRQINGPGIQTLFSPVAYSADGQRLAISNPFKTMSIWNTITGQEVLTLGRAGLCKAFSRDGRRLATVASSANLVELWDTASGECVVTLIGHSSDVLCAAYSPDGRRIATGSHDGSVKVWNTTTGQENFTFKAHTSQVSGLAFSPDGHRLASAGGDLKVNIWDATPAP